MPMNVAPSASESRRIAADVSANIATSTAKPTPSAAIPSSAPCTSARELRRRRVLDHEWIFFVTQSAASLIHLVA